MRPAVLLLVLFPLSAAPPEACSPCHATEVQKQIRSHHALALRPISESPLLDIFRDNAHPSGTDPALTYEVRPGGVRVSEESSPAGTLQWAFGAGAQGITPVGTVAGRAFEHRFSYYPKAQRFGLTFGHPARAASPESRLGVPQDARALAQCLSCHSTGDRPGITCDRCHGASQSHIDAARAGASKEAIRRAIVNPGRFPARAQAQMCGECHRLPEPGPDAPEPEIEDPISVRFSPIGLMASRCFQMSKRLTCTTCHDPHENVRPRDDASYAGKCQACHAQSKSRRPRPAQGDCVSCHMRHTSIGPYLKFTDHRIRVL